MKTLNIVALLSSLVVLNIQGMESGSNAFQETSSSSSSPTTTNLSIADAQRRNAYNSYTASSSNNNNSSIIKGRNSNRSLYLIEFAQALKEYCVCCTKIPSFEKHVIEEREKIKALMMTLLSKMNFDDVTVAAYLARQREWYEIHRNGNQDLMGHMWNDFWKGQGYFQAPLLENPEIPVDESSLFDPYRIGDRFLSNWQKTNPPARPDICNIPDINEYEIRRGYTYIPDHDVSKGTMVFFVVHGTRLLDYSYSAGPFNIEYSDPDDLKNTQKTNFRNFMRFAAWYANEHDQKVELLSFRWPGTNSSNIRNNAAIFLKNYIDQYYSDEGVELGFFGHSHGCNIGNMLSLKLQKPIELLIYFACPVRDTVKQQEGTTNSQQSGKTETPSSRVPGYEKDELSTDEGYTPDKFNKLVFFFSTMDEVAALGAIDKWSLVKDVGSGLVGFGGAAFLAYSRGITLSNSGEILRFAQVGFKGLFRGNSAKSFNNSYLFKNQNRTMIGIRVQCEGKGPGHSEVPYVAAVLPEIFQILKSQYSAHCSLNSLFDVNYANEVSLRKRYDAFCLAIRKQGSDVSKKDDEQAPNQEIEFKKTLVREQEYSKEQKEKFVRMYAEEIDQYAHDSLAVWSKLSSFVKRDNS